MLKRFGGAYTTITKTCCGGGTTKMISSQVQFSINFPDGLRMLQKGVAYEFTGADLEFVEQLHNSGAYIFTNI